MKAFHRTVHGITYTLAVVFLSTLQTSAVIINFTEHPQSREVRFNDSVTLQCAVSNGVVTQWLFNNGPLIPNVDITVNEGTLIIGSFQRELAGNYRCVAESTTGSFTQVSHYARISYFTQRQFESQPEDYVVYQLQGGAREAAIFRCEFNQLRNGIRPVLRWEVRAGGTSTTLEQTMVAGRFVPFQYDHSAYLELHFPTAADNGIEVRCLASDPGSLDQIVESNWASVIISNDGLPPGTPTFSVRSPSQVHFIEGQELVLGCAKTAHNVSTGIRWGLLGQPTFYIQALGDVLFQPLNVTIYGYTNIMLERPSSNHFGITYQCSTLVAAQEEEVVNTTVIPPPPPLPLPAYTDQSQFSSFTYGTNTILEITNYTGAIQWWHNGTAITANTTKYMVLPAMNRLLIINVSFSDAGIYQAELLDTSPVRQFAIFDVNVVADECALMLHDCHSAAVCVDTPTSFTCTCTSGFSGDGRTCTDIDECVLDVDSCPINAICTNTFGNYTCQCNIGFQGDGRSCTDIDECQQGTDNCHINATCMNTDGSYTCSCNDGFQGDGRSCSTTDIDECELNLDSCHTDATCMNTDGSYTCQCNIGFQGDGRSCSATDIDECELDLDSCHTDATCMNTDGSYTCQCNVGFQGDGRSCSALSPPMITSVEVVNGTHLRINWTTPTQPVDAYVLEISQNDGSTTAVTVQQNFFILPNANLNSEYNFRVQATSAAGNSTFTGRFVYQPRGMESAGLRQWQIALIVLFVLLVILLCCILCCCIAFAWKKRRRTYYAEKREKRYAQEFQQFRQEDDIDTKD